MAKDPAFLWYWSDWHGGISTFTRHLKGCYMDLLYAQFNSGPLSIDEIRTVLGTDFGQSWPTLQKKFTATNAGLFYNKRMEEEKEKRKNFTDSRRKNLASDKKTPHMADHMAKPMGTHMEDENRDAVGIKKGDMGEADPETVIQRMANTWKRVKPEYPFDEITDMHALFGLGGFLAERLKGMWPPEKDVGALAVLETWERLAAWIVADDFYTHWALGQICTTKNLQTIWQKSKDKKNGTGKRTAPSGGYSGRGPTNGINANAITDTGVGDDL